jgi:hypothetical protein
MVHGCFATPESHVECRSDIYCCLCFEVDVGVLEEGLGLRVPTCAVAFLILDLMSVSSRRSGVIRVPR